MSIFDNHFDLSGEEKRAILPAIINRLVSAWDWAVSDDMPISLMKKQEIIAYRRALKRLDLSEPDSVIIPDVPTVTVDDFLPATADAVQDGAVVAVQSVPGWATWSKAQAVAWYTENIVTPLDAPLPATVSAATNRQIIIALIGVMKDMGVMLWALAQMVIALRNRSWPGLQE
jgi:hypothetical protein